MTITIKQLAAELHEPADGIVDLLDQLVAIDGADAVIVRQLADRIDTRRGLVLDCEISDAAAEDIRRNIREMRQWGHGAVYEFRVEDSTSYATRVFHDEADAWRAFREAVRAAASDYGPDAAVRVALARVAVDEYGNAIEPSAQVIAERVVVHGGATQ